MLTLDHRSGIVALLAIAAMATGCTLDDQRAPSLVGPSGLAYQVSLAAAPDFVVRDGSSVSVVTATVRGADGQLLGGQRLRLSVSTTPGAGGRLSVPEVVTGGNGQASFQFTAPGVSDDVSEAVIGATPVGTDAADNLMRTVRISVLGPSVPIPSFTFSPAAPLQFETVTFDASGTTAGGSACTGCTYAWDFGTGDTGRGQLAQYVFRSPGNSIVTLTVTTPSGATRSTAKVVSVGAASKPTASFVISPTNPTLGDVVNANASASTTTNGATIAQYRWNFGNGSEESRDTPTASVTYTVARTYVVTLTIVDSNGTASAPVTQTVTVAAPVVPVPIAVP